MYQLFLDPGVPLEGGRGRYLAEQRETATAYLHFNSLPSLAKLLPKDMRIKAQPHSFCMTSLQEPFCGSECIYNQTKCIDCKNGVIHPMHLPVWQDMAERQRALLALPDLSKAQRQDAHEKLRKIEHVICTLQKREIKHEN